MKNYQDILQDNSIDFNDADNLTDFVNNYTSDKGDDVKELEDYIAEYVDGLCPIYYADIVKEWHENGDCHEMTLEVCGEYAEKDIYKMMTSDLYFYYEQQLREDYNKFIELLEEAEDDKDEEERQAEDIK